jgi:hypothetical protein
MMVPLEMGVECAAKIEMSALRTGSATMGLLPDHALARCIFLAVASYKIVNRKLGRNIRRAPNCDCGAVDLAGKAACK